MFNAGPQFVFNIGGGPGFRVHQFGGARPRRRPQEAGAQGTPANLRSTIANLLPLIILFIIPLISSIFSGTTSTPAGPQMRFNSDPPFTAHRLTSRLKVDYYVNPADIVDYTTQKFRRLDDRAEVAYVQQLRFHCGEELQEKRKIVEEATGWFFHDENKLERARSMELKNCRQLNDMGVPLHS
jgi:DnaJ homolog subfamily B member 12